MSMTTETITRQYRYPAGGIDITLAAVFEGDICLNYVVRISAEEGHIKLDKVFDATVDGYYQAKGEFDKQVENRT